MNKETVELFKVSMYRDIPDNQNTRQIFVDNLSGEPINALDICSAAMLLIEAFMNSVPDQFQIENEIYILETLPILLKNRHLISTKE